MVSKKQQRILLFYYKHQEEYIDLYSCDKFSKDIDQASFSALIEKEYLASAPGMSVEVNDCNVSIHFSDKYKITDTGIDLAEQIKENNRNRISFWNGTIGGIIGAIGGIFGIISFFSS